VAGGESEGEGLGEERRGGDVGVEMYKR